MPVRHEYRITASAEDAWLGVSKKSGIPTSELPPYDFTWYSHTSYDAKGVMCQPKNAVLTARAAALRFWDQQAHKWPSAELTVTRIESTTSRIRPTDADLAGAANGVAL